MDFLLDAINNWLKELLISGITNNLTGLFDSLNQEVSGIAAQVGKTPADWNGSIFNMIRTLSETVIVPIAGILLTFVMCMELIQLIIDKNNLHDFETWIFFKWIFKTFCAVLIVTKHLEHRHGRLRRRPARGQPECRHHHRRHGY